MLNEAKIKQAVEEFSKNPYWREFYEKAPSKNAKRRVALGFFWSETQDQNEAHEAMAEADKLEKSFGREECEWFLKHSDLAQEKAYWKKKINELSA